LLPYFVAIDGVGVGDIAGVDSAILLACLALAAATLIFIFYIEPDAADSAPHRTHLDQLLERRDVIYDNLRDVKFEHRAGKYSEQDYEETKRLLEDEAAAVLAEIETVTDGQARPPHRVGSPRMDPSRP
jgi:hypothetical protein